MSSSITVSAVFDTVMCGVPVGVLVVPVPLGDQLLSPSSLLARTCTSYSVASARPGMLVLVAVTSCGPLMKSPVVPWR